MTGEPPAALHELAPAKINLTLRVLGRRPDGYHELDSLVVFAGDEAADRITLDPRRGAEVAVSGRHAGAIVGDNIAWRALRLVADRAPHLPTGAVTIDKRLPVASGVGGGSADAAAVLRALRRLAGADGIGVDWLGAAAQLGADVPVCFGMAPARMRGLGERLEPLAALPRLAAVLVTPDAVVPADKTAQVFRRLAAEPLPADYVPDPAGVRLATVADVVDHITRIGNDLTAPAIGLVPAIGEALALLRARPGCQCAAMSGSGPSCYGIFDRQAAAAAAADEIAVRRPQWFAVATTFG